MTKIVFITDLLYNILLLFIYFTKYISYIIVYTEHISILNQKYIKLLVLYNFKSNIRTINSKENFMTKMYSWHNMFQ